MSAPAVFHQKEFNKKKIVRLFVFIVFFLVNADEEITPYKTAESY